MTATSHSLVGAFIAAKIQNPTLGLPLAIAAHFATDLIPHWDLGTNWKKRSKTKTVVYSLLDSLLGLILGFLFFPSNNPFYLFLMISFSQLPDYFSAISWFWGIKIHPFDWIAEEQKKFHARVDLPWGIITQIAITLILIEIK